MKNCSTLLIIILMIGTAAGAQKIPREAPPGFDEERSKIEGGKIDTISYASKMVRNTRKALIYTPPESSKEKKYPLLYLLSGIDGDDKRMAERCLSAGDPG